jgi:uncharacterized protein
VKFSEGRQSHLAHEIVRVLKSEGLADVEREKYVLAEIKRVFEAEHQRGDLIDDLVRQKIASLSRHVPAGSPEWDILYKRYYEEEERKHRR